MKRDQTPLIPSIHLDGFCRPDNPSSEPQVAGNIMPMVTGTIFLYKHNLSILSHFHSSSAGFCGYKHLIVNRDASGIGVNAISFNK